MELYIIRHAIAEDRAEFRAKSWDDSKRPLTPEGKKKFKQIAKKLKKLIGPVDLIICSPFVRAKQTASILAAQYPEVDIVNCVSLTPPSSPIEFSKWCSDHLKRNSKKIILVGHEPSLSIITSWLLFGSYQSRVNLKKGGCLSISIKGAIGPERGTLNWALPPKVLLI